MKIDSGTDTCILTTDDLHVPTISFDLQPPDSILKGYGESRIENYYTRTIDEILPRMHGKKYFSVADTNKGYWHVEHDEGSSLLCTINTLFGRYRFKGLPFGVSVSHDIFQRKLDEVYKDIPNVTVIADDIIIAGSTQQEHNQAFIRMLWSDKEEQ